MFDSKKKKKDRTCRYNEKKNEEYNDNSLSLFSFHVKVTLQSVSFAFHSHYNISLTKAMSSLVLLSSCGK